MALQLYLKKYAVPLWACLPWKPSTAIICNFCCISASLYCINLNNLSKVAWGEKNQTKPSALEKPFMLDFFKGRLEDIKRGEKGVVGMGTRELHPWFGGSMSCKKKDCNLLVLCLMHHHHPQQLATPHCQLLLHTLFPKPCQGLWHLPCDPQQERVAQGGAACPLSSPEM